MRKQKGFTLVELLIVIVIIATLASVAFFSLSGETSNSHDAVRKKDLNTFQDAVLNTLAKGYLINKGAQNQITTNYKDSSSDFVLLNSIRGATITFINKNTFEESILKEVSTDPKGIEYIAVFLNNNIYQFFSTLENEFGPGIQTALVQGTLRAGAQFDILSSKVSIGDAQLKVFHADSFIIGDTLKIEDEEFTVAGVIDSQTVDITGDAATKIHVKGSSVFLSAFAPNADTLLCVGPVVDVDANTSTLDDRTCSTDDLSIPQGAIRDNFQLIPYTLDPK
jgi:prepilin-type N-terminal cleavage/methylation domain-containing protein